MSLPTQSLTAKIASGAPIVCCLKLSAALKKGDTVRAVPLLNKSFVEFNAVGDRKATGLIQKIVGIVLDGEKDIDRARTAFQESISILKEARLAPECVQVCLIGAKIEVRLMEFNRAFSLFRLAVSVARDHSYAAGEIRARIAQGVIELQRGRLVEARQCLADAQVLSHKTDDPHALAEIETLKSRLS